MTGLTNSGLFLSSRKGAFIPGSIGAARGDSITDNAFTDTATAKNFNHYGFITQFNKIAKGSLYIPARNIFAESGYTTAQMETAGFHISTSLSRAAFSLDLSATNDVGVGLLLATDTIIATRMRMADADALKGVRPVVYAIPPNGNLTATGAKRRDYVNQVLKKRCSDKGYLFVDVAAWVVDPTSATSAHLTAFYSDTLHPNEIGAYLFAWPAVQAILRPEDIYFPAFACAGDSYDATHNVYGNKLDNGLMQGTGGTESTGVTVGGDTATSWTAVNANGYSGPDCVVTKVARTETFGPAQAGSWQQVAVPSGTVTVAGSKDITQNVNSGRWAVGETVELEAECEVDTGFTKFLGPRIQLYSNGSGGLGTADGQGTSGQIIYDTGATQRFVYRTPPHTIPAGSTVLQTNLSSFLDAGTAAANVRWTRASCRRVVV